ncbi:MAG TPA: isoaspartyl peptidase/L-asparaginase, partial [Planctomycetaceae bacterium]|nr:isoaspartyl peptidase/L-asparaginase [Planctomycetaceae bacterium]
MPRLWMCVLMTMTATGSAADRFDPTVADVVLGIHGGIGDADQVLEPQVEKEMRAAMELALKNGHA